MSEYRRGEQGFSLVIVMMLVLVMVGLAYAYMVQSSSQRIETRESTMMEQAFYLAESGVSSAVAELNSGDDPAGDGLGVLLAGYAGGEYRTVVTDLGEFAFKVISVGNYNERKRAVEVVAQQSKIPLEGAVRGAVTADGDVFTLGNILIDGRDFDETGTKLVGKGKQGISSRRKVGVDGSSSCGGNGKAPVLGATPGDGVFEERADWSDGIDNDGDGWIDEEFFDGIDNDGDERIDEDIKDSYPASPDIALHLPPGTLEMSARYMGTYFDDPALYQEYLLAQGGNVPGGVIIFLAFDSIEPMAFGPILNEDPSIVIMHNATGSAEMKNLHGQFKGLIMADVITHINGDFRIVGAVHSFADENLGNAYGN